MYNRPQRSQNVPAQRKSDLKKFPAPTGGWISNRNLSSPMMGEGTQGQGAAVLDNFFPTSTTAILRRGKELYATLGQGDLEVQSLFTYVNGLNRKMFSSTDSTIYDITTVLVPYNWRLITQDGDYIVTENGDYFGQSSTEDLEKFQGSTSGKWITVQFATDGGIYLIGVNGVDAGFIYDGNAFYPYVPGGAWALSYDNITQDFIVGEVITGGTSGATGTVYEIIPGGGLVLIDVTGTFQDNEFLNGSDGGDAQASSASSNIVPGITFPDSLTTADMSYVWAYKNRVWFAQKESLNIWYMDEVAAVGGEPVLYPMGGIFITGGSILWGDAWAIGTGAAGGLSDQMVVTSSEGEVAVFQGSNPGTLGDWTHVGTYRIGRPLGNRAHFRGGGDIAVATSVGLIPLSKAISLDVTALSPAAVSYSIQDAWQQAVDGRGLDDWSCMLWPERKMAIMSPPITIGDYDPVLFISNSETGAWCRYTNWDARAMCVFQGEMYFGGPNGEVFRANVTGSDNGSVYTGVYIPLFDDLGQPANLKIPKLGRGVTRAKANLTYGLQFKSDFNTIAGAAPTASSADGTNAWGSGVWGQSVWGGTNPNVFNAQWKSLGGSGYYISACYQVTSGGNVPLDVEIVHIEMSYTTAEIVT